MFMIRQVVFLRHLMKTKQRWH